MALRSSLIRLAHANPRIRPHILAILKRADGKKLRVFDFDDTLVSSPGSVTIVGADGNTHKLNSETFAYYTPVEGDEIDFGNFNHVDNPRIIKANFDKFREATKDSDTQTVILTARPKGSASAVTKFLADQGIKNVKVVALASSDPYDKARWIDKEIESGGYSDVEFTDDSKSNANAVREHGEKHKTKGVKFTSTNTQHPKEHDYEGPAAKTSFKSDDPTTAKVKITSPKAPSEAKKPAPEKGNNDWWESQSDNFHHNYCKEHPGSGYCGHRTAMNDPNKSRKDAILSRADKATPAVKTYVEKHLVKKIDQAGAAAGIWLESLEGSVQTMKPEGLFKGFSKKDFDSLYKVLSGD